MNKAVEVIQNGYKDCGPSCLLSIMRYYGFDASHEELTLLLKTDINGTTAYNLINGAKNIGFDGYGIRYSFNDIISSNISFPIIVHVLINNMYHYIVLYGINTKKKFLKVMDPAYGNKKLSFKEFESIYQKTALILYPVKKITDISKRDNIKTYISNYIKSNYIIFIIFIMLSILMVFLSIISNYYLQVIIDKILKEFLYKKLIIISILFLNILLFKSLISFVRCRYLIIISNDIGIKMNNNTIRHIFNLPYLFFKNKSTGEVIKRVSDIKEFKDILSNIIVNLSMDLILIICSVTVLLIINVKLFFITLLFVILYSIVVLIYSKKHKKNINEFQINDGMYNKVLTESIEGYEANKNINLTNHIVKNIEMKYIIFTKKYIKFQNTLNRQIFIKDILMNLSYIITIFLGAIYINNNEITLGNFIVFNSILIYFTEPIRNILDLFPNINYMKNIYIRINDLLIMKSNPITESNIKLSGDIEFNNVSYSYNNINNSLYNVNIKIKNKDKYLIYGDSGCGKSTLLKLLLKYIDDFKGSILINGVNILDMDNSLISSSFTYVSQNNYLNNDTLKNNIICNREICNEDYEKVINICHINTLRDSKSLRNDFIIEDNGFNISGGERQKIILARSLLKDSNYIILDEALSEVGYEEERDIINKIIEYYEDKTIIFVSHKKEIIELFEKKYYLERSQAC